MSNGDLSSLILGDGGLSLGLGARVGCSGTRRGLTDIIGFIHLRKAVI